MKKTILALVLWATACQAFAFAEKDAAQLVKNYSKSVACQVEPTFRPVKIRGGAGPAELGDRYVVYWEGDVGCMGGNGTVVPNLTVVEMAAFETPVVLPTFNVPELSLVSATKITGKDDILLVQGVTYGPHDQQHAPRKPVSYRLKMEDAGFVKQ